MAKKKFGISPAVNKALTQTIKMAEAENSNFLNTEILLERVMLDPDNPRKHKITLDDIKHGLSKKDPLYKEKEMEYESLMQLSSSIKNEGLLHPIIVIEENNDFRLIAGERRYFASMIAERKVIEARVFKKRPKNFDLKVIQWSENQSRKDLNLFKKLMNVKAILDAYEVENESMTAIKLAEVLGVSRQQGQFYKAILSNETLLEFIKGGEISTMEVARQLTMASHKEIVSFLVQGRVEKASVSLKEKRNTESRNTVVNLGVTKKTAVAQTITETMLQNHLQHHADDFKKVNWGSHTESSKAFKRLIALLEKDEALV